MRDGAVSDAYQVPKVMVQSAAWFVIISCIAVFFEFGGLVKDSTDMVRLFALLFLVLLLIGVVSTLVLIKDKGPTRSSERHNQFRRILRRGRAAD
jgi:uncharacterized membrane protein YtjA (UPF0391 family)